MKCLYCNKLISQSRINHGSNYCSVECYTKGYYKDNNGTILIKAKKYRDNPKRKEEKQIYMNKYRKDNKININSTQRRYWANNREKKKELDKKYYNNNWEKIYNRIKYRRKNDINFKLKDHLRTMMHKAIKNNYKYTSTTKLSGCSIQFLRNYLEKQWKPGMNWKNHTFHGWHIDHIKPISSFDLSKEEEQKKCFHYTNLQPLWAREYEKRK